MCEITELQARYNRVAAERDTLLSAISPEDYEKIKDKLIAISETPDVLTPAL